MAEPMNDPVTGLMAGQQADATTGGTSGTGGLGDGVTTRVDTTDQMADTISGASADQMDSGMGAGLGGGMGSAGAAQGNSADTLGIQEHMEVVGSDGDHVGVVDKVENGQIKLTRNDIEAGGKHHLIGMDMVQSVDTVVRLNLPGRIAQEQWQTAD